MVDIECDHQNGAAAPAAACATFQSGRRCWCARTDRGGCDDGGVVGVGCVDGDPPSVVICGCRGELAAPADRGQTARQPRLSRGRGDGRVLSYMTVNGCTRPMCQL